MRRSTLALVMALAFATTGHGGEWTQLAPIPDAEGFAGPFAGVSGGALIVAGGANITGDKWAEPLTKKWYARTFILTQPDGAWAESTPLPRPLGYGVSITVDDRLVCLGGSDEREHHREVFALKWSGGALQRTDWPSLPRPCANACGALIGQTIYVAGGLETPTSTTALGTFWALDVDHLERGWRELETWPGAPRIFGVAGVVGSDFLLFSGASLHADADGKAARTFLRDAYRYTPDQGWRRLADLPRSAVAAASPAITARDGTLRIVSGDDGLNVTFQPLLQHPGFPRDTLVYDPSVDRWQVEAGAPFSRATVPTVRWGERFVVPNGEVRPRVRTPEVWSWKE